MFEIPVFHSRIGSRNCPVCKSTKVGMRFFVNTSKINPTIYNPVINYCECGFESNESFGDINFRNVRDEKINNILYGVQ